MSQSSALGTNKLAFYIYPITIIDYCRIAEGQEIDIINKEYGNRIYFTPYLLKKCKENSIDIEKDIVRLINHEMFHCIFFRLDLFDATNKIKGIF